VKHVPVLLLHGGADTNVRLSNQSRAWSIARAAAAPWTLSTQRGVPHHSVDGLIADNPLMLRWLEAVIDGRVARDQSVLRAFSVDSTLIGPHSGGPVVRAGTAISDSIGTSWLPNRRTAIAWLFQRGVCKTTKPSHLVNILGDNALVATDEGWLCEYRAKEDGSDPRRLVVVFSGLRIPGTGILGDRHVESTRQVDVPGRTIVPRAW
jgi:hypothetical protein